MTQTTCRSLKRRRKENIIELLSNSFRSVVQKSERMSLSEDATFEPLVVLQFSPNTPSETKEWAIKRLTASHDQDEGADLLVRYDTDPESHVSKFDDLLI